MQPCPGAWRLGQTHCRTGAVAGEDNAGDTWARLHDAYLFLPSRLQIKLLERGPVPEAFSAALSVPSTLLTVARVTGEAGHGAAACQLRHPTFPSKKL